MTNSLIITTLFILSALFINFGVVLQSKAVLDKGLGNKGKGRLWGASTKYLGFAMCAYLIYESKAENLVFNLSIFTATYLFAFLLYLLARRVSLR